MPILNQSLKIKNIILTLVLSFSLLAFTTKGNIEKTTSKYSTDLVGYIGKSPIFMHLKINETDNGDHCCPKRFSSITNFIDFTGLKSYKNAFCDFDPSFI